MPTFEWSLETPAATTPTTSSHPADSSPRDLKTDAVTGDLVLSGSDLSFSVGIDAVRQDVERSLRFFLGEWFLDQSLGLPLFEEVLVRNPNLVAVRARIREHIEARVGIGEVVELVLDYEPTTRTLSIIWEATADLDELVDDVRIGSTVEVATA